MSNTYSINHDFKVVSPLHGYYQNWKSLYKKAEHLGYTYKSGYGFEVNTSNRTFVLADTDTFYRVVNKTSTNWNDIKDYQEIVKAWKYFRTKGYTTEDSYLNTIH